MPDADSSAEPLVFPLVRRVFDAGHTSTLPGTLVRAEGDAPVADVSVNDAYDALGETYQCYSTLFGRDSVDGAGLELRGTVHYGLHYSNAFWNGQQMVYGDGDGSGTGSWAAAHDMTMHELTHAVIDYEAGLSYANESGAFNESLADIMAARCESFVDGAVQPDNWLIGEDMWTPSQPGDALRYMCNPTLDGYSKDWYPERQVGGGDNGGVHANSGISNLAFCLLVNGGTHPRGKSTVVVPGIGMDQAGAIFYRALTEHLTSSTDFTVARVATEQAATDLYGKATAEAVGKAWDAVGVLDVPPLYNGVNVPMAGGIGSQKFYRYTVPAGWSARFATSGGTGNSDLYVKVGSLPTPSSYDQASITSTNNESITVTATTTTTYYVMVRGMSVYNGANLVVWNTLLKDAGIMVSGDAGSAQVFRFVVPTGFQHLNLQTAIGGQGNLDLYIRKDYVPTTTSYDARSINAGALENITLTGSIFVGINGTYYVMVRGTSAFTPTRLTATYY